MRVVDRMEGIVDRVERIVGIGESVIVTACRHRTRGARRDQRGAPNHRPVVPDSLPVPVPADRRGHRPAVGRAGRRRRRRDRRSASDPPRRHVRRAKRRDHYLFTFSPAGVESFYALPEETASKGLADYLMLRRKLPDEIFDGRRDAAELVVPPRRRRLLSGQPRPGARHTVAELGSEAPSTSSTSPAGSGTGWDWRRGRDPDRREGDAFERLVSAFDTLDGSDAFVHPDAMAAVAASDKRAERAALDDVVEIVADAVRRLDSRPDDRRARCSAGSSRPGRRSRPKFGTRGIALRRRADPHRVDVEPDGGTRLGLGRPARAPGRAAPRSSRGDSELARALRAGEHADGAALDHVADRAGAGRPRHRRRHATGCPPAGRSPRCCRC